MRWHLNHLQRYATGFFLTCWVCLYLTPDRTGWPKLAGKQPGINDTYWDKMSWKYVWLRTENCLNSVFCICGSQTHIYVYIYIYSTCETSHDIPRKPLWNESSNFLSAPRVFKDEIMRGVWPQSVWRWDGDLAGFPRFILDKLQADELYSLSNAQKLYTYIS